MKNKRLFSVLSLIINIVIFMLMVHTLLNNFRTDILRNTEMLDAGGWVSFRYFTMLSNILAAIAAVIVAGFDVKNLIRDEYAFPRWVLILKYAGTVAVTLTFVTVVVFLGPMVQALGYGYFTLFKNENFFLHFLSPVLAIVSFICFERIENFKFIETLYGVIPTVLYSFAYLPMVVIGKENGGWPDFYMLTFGGHMWVAPISLVVMYGATFGLAVAERAAQKAIAKKLLL